MRISLDIPPGLNGDDTAYAAAGRWADASNVRFYRGRPQTIGGWESLTPTLLTGVCRNVFNWSDNSGALNIAFGTHSDLQVWVGGTLYTITPTLALPPYTLLAADLTATDGSATITAAILGHGMDTGDTVIISGSTTVGRATVTGTKTVTVVNEDSFTFSASGAADLSKTLGSNPLATVSGSPVVTITETGHNISSGTTVTISGAAAVGGLTPNGSYTVTVVDANSYKITMGSNASSTTTGGGASVVVDVPATGGVGLTFTPQKAFAAGAIDGAGGAGYGTGAYSIGGYSEPSTADFYPRTWGLGAFGEWLIANPRGGTIYAWKNDTGVDAEALTNAPRQVSHAIVAPQDQIFALGCNEEVSGDFNALCIRHCSVKKATEWNTNTNTTAREYVLPGGGRIVGGRVIANNLLVWTNHALFLGTFVGSINQPWRFDQVGKNCGLIGPNAAAVVGQAAFWIGPDLQFYRYQLGLGAQAIECPIRTDFVENLTPTQADKISAGTISSFTEVRWDYPDNRDGTENSRYLTLNVSDGSWSKGLMARTAWCDAGPNLDPIGVTAQGNAYWHERGATADGQAFSWFIESADQYLDENFTMRVNSVWPDIGAAQQIGPVYVTLKSRLKPQSEERVFGPYGMAVGQSKVDVRASGRLFKVRYSGNSVPTSARLGRPIFDVERTGRR